MRKTKIAVLALLTLPAPALANDSSAAIAIGGLALTQNDAISMDSEDLFLSEAEVRVRYRFTNRTNHDVATLVSFPVPDLPGGISGYLGDRSLPDYRELGFRTTIDGKPVTLGYVERAEIASPGSPHRDVTARLAALGWPLRWGPIDYDQDLSFIDKLSEAQKAGFIREGLLAHSAEYDMLLPAWNLVTHVTRRQVFAAGKTVEVTHRYVPLVGGSVGGNLDPEQRQSDYFPEHAKQYCIDRAFLSAFDRRQGTKPPGERPAYSERWLSYLLSPGANWRGPIGQFRLVIDKGRPGNLVSLCMDGVTKISPTQFEVRKTNFEPKQDIDVMIVTWNIPE